MIGSAQMVADGYAEATEIKVRQVPHLRAWDINGVQYTDQLLRDCAIDPKNITAENLMTLAQFYQAGLITSKEARERMKFKQYGVTGLEVGPEVLHP